MKITPHLVIETCLDLARSDVWRSKKAVSGCLQLIGQSTLFDFGSNLASMEHKAFALDLYERGLFGLPFPVTAFAFEAPPIANPHIASSRQAGGMMVLHMDEDGRISAIMCTEMRAPDGRTMGAIPFGLVMRAKLSDPKGDSVSVDEETYPLVDDEMMAAIYGGPMHDRHDTMRNRLCSNLVGCMGLTVMLMSKGIITEHVPAPAKLNKARALKGKPRIADRYVVSLDPGLTRQIVHADGSESDITGHVRGHPRPHWRRGHFRTLYRGTSDERVVPVAPALIAANESSPATKAIYRLKETA